MIVKSKVCNVCNIEKTISQFYKRKDSVDGHKHSCKKCKAEGKKFDIKKRFISKVVNIHGDKISFEKTRYKNANTKITLTCKIHGDFVMTPSNFLRYGCKKCNRLKTDTAYLEKYIKKLKAKFKNALLYDNIELKGKNRVLLECKKHGKFETRAYRQLGCKYPCKNCERESREISKEDLVNRLTKVHGDTYNYDKAVWVDAKTKIEIGCSIHGYFKQTYNSHLQGNGCPKCGRDISDKARRKMSPEVAKMSKKLRNRIKEYILNSGLRKNKSTVEILGANYNEVEKHLNNNKFGFNLEQINIDIDHIIPLSEASSEKELIKLCHYTNLQLLPAYYNRFIKRNLEQDENKLKKWLMNNPKTKWKASGYKQKIKNSDN